MGKYVYAYKGGGMAATEEEQARRDGRMGAPGSASSATRSSTAGNPFGGSTAVTAGGSNGAAASGLTGYSVVVGVEPRRRGGEGARLPDLRERRRPSTSTRRSRCSSGRAGRPTPARPPTPARSSAARRRSRPRSPCPATVTHSRTEWYSLPPVKMFGVGRPISVSREPSVPPRIDSSLGSSPTRRVASSAASTTCGTRVERLAHVAVLIPALDRHATRAARSATASSARRCTSATCSSSFAPSWSRTISVTVTPLGAALDLVRVHEALAALGRLGRERVGRKARDEPRRELDRVHEHALRRARDGRRRPWNVTFSSTAEKVSFSISPTTCAVERVGEVGAEAVEVEVVGAVADLLVDREADPRSRPRDLGVRERARRPRP